MHKVLLLSQKNDSRSFLSVTRSLGQKGIIVHVTSNKKTSPSICSRYINKIIFLPDYSCDNDKWKFELIELLKIENYTLIIPCDDLSIIYLEAHKKDIARYAKLYLLDTNIYNIVNNKHRTYKLASSLNINVPKSILIKDNDNIENIHKQFSFPLILKPISSFDIKSINRHEVNIVDDLATLQSQLKLMLNHTQVQVQSFFEGIGVAVSLLAQNGKVIVASQHKRLHEPFTGGGSSYRMSMLIDQELFEAAEKIISKLNYTGVAMVEFRYNIKTKEWVLLEINGRFWGSLPLAISAGIDYPYFLFLLIVGGEIPTSKIIYKPNVYQRNLELDMYWLNDALYNSDDKELLSHSYTRKRIFYECLRILIFKDKIDTFSIKDPAPFIAETLLILKQINYFIIKKIRFRLLQNVFIRRIIRRNLRAKILKAKHVLFVCKGNICRSPFAQHAAISLWKKIPQIDSTGYYKEINRAVPDVALNSSSNYSIDLSTHRSASINLEQVKKADLIFYFDEENRSYLHEKFGSYKYKMYFIGLLSEKSSVEIEDPIDKSANEFSETYKYIYKLLKDI